MAKVGDRRQVWHGRCYLRALETRRPAARGAYTCLCTESEQKCCCDKDCACARVPEDRDTNNGIPAKSVQRVEPWSYATTTALSVLPLTGSGEPEFFSAGFAVRNHSLVCMGIRLNC
jgi:hypothetical protein